MRTWSQPERGFTRIPAADRDGATNEDELVVRFAAYTGLRPGELEAVRICDINFLRRHVEARRQAQHTPKVGWEYLKLKSSKSVQDVPLWLSLLLAPSRSDPDALLWPGRRKGGQGDNRAPLSYDHRFSHESVYGSYVRAMEAAGIQPLAWYSFRHYYASACAAAGCPNCDLLASRGHLTRQEHGHSVIECEWCGHELDRIRDDSARWIGSDWCGHDGHLECTSFQCRCECHTYGRAKHPQYSGVSALWNADIHLSHPNTAPRALWVVTDARTIRLAAGEHERKTA